VARSRFWLDLGPRNRTEDIERLESALGTRFALNFTEDKLGNCRLDIVSVASGHSWIQVRRRLEELLDQALPEWRGRYTLNPIVTAGDYEWIQAMAVVVFGAEVALDEAHVSAGELAASRDRIAHAYQQAAARGLVAPLQRQVSFKQDARAWLARQQKLEI
jgi:hypothetical protein